MLSPATTMRSSSTFSRSTSWASAPTTPNFSSSSTVSSTERVGFLNGLSVR